MGRGVGQIGDIRNCAAKSWVQPHPRHAHPGRGPRRAGYPERAAGPLQASEFDYQSARRFCTGAAVGASAAQARVGQSGFGLTAGFVYTAPYEEATLKSA